MKQLAKSWNSYKYRFVPWLMINWKDRSVRNVALAESQEKASVKEEQMLYNLLSFFCVLERNESGFVAFNKDIHVRNCEHMEKAVGFCVRRQKSQLPGGGLGVVVSKGMIRKGQVASLYPGTVYRLSEPLFLQSLANKFILQCLDGIFIDGNNRGLSKYIYKSCVQRDRVGYILPADTTWLSDTPVNPMAVGQFVNNHSKSNPANVAYQECNIPRSIEPSLLQLLPNVNFSSNNSFVRAVALIALRDIQAGEELFSSYFTIVKT